jgi:hypothetical protein
MSDMGIYHKLTSQNLGYELPVTERGQPNWALGEEVGTHLVVKFCIYLAAKM